MVTNTDLELGVVAAGESSTENAFKDEYVPPWYKQITLRAMFTGFVLSVVFNFIVCKLNHTTGVIPSHNVAAGLLGFAGIKSWTALTQKFGMLKQPFTRQENTVIQTCVVASSGIAFSSGTASYRIDDEHTRHSFWIDGRFQDWLLNPYIPAFHVL
ncbi:probable metal-nicotianamine transporter YSL7 [Solanum stenotomum]|uniref:probable metal-nicotianamine transporter YSL7 n=1 Tax=Solanum stenotomum TaxID=172797 RepID=UPI0020D042DF|nr:probable metal-nicotianamine transporter YSL7 [Solanum stenotomum]